MVAHTAKSSEARFAAGRPVSAWRFAHALSWLKLFLVLVIVGLTVHLGSVVVQLLRPIELPARNSKHVTSPIPAQWILVSPSISKPPPLPLTDDSQSGLCDSNDRRDFGLAQNLKRTENAASFAFSLCEIGDIVMQRHAESGEIDGWLLETGVPVEQLSAILNNSGVSWTTTDDHREYHVKATDGRQYVIIPGARKRSGTLIITVLNVGAI